MMNPELLAYSEAHSTPESPVLEKLNRETHLTQLYPRMLAGQLQGNFLRMVSQMLQPRRILEIGTFTGYSTICLAMGLDNAGTPGPSPQKHLTPDPSPEGEGSTIGSSILHTIEVNPELEGMIRRYLAEAGLEKNVLLHIGNAFEIIPTLGETWDLVYIDADKPNYLNYYKMVFDRLRTGGFLLADNVLWDGKVLKERARLDKDTRGIVEFNEYVMNDDRAEKMILPFRDGIMMVRKLA
ncbi:MAG: O-methyltransferase [bacterium]